MALLAIVKLLLDEQLPRKLARSFPDKWEVFSVRQMDWLGTSNGALLAKAVAHDFTAMITADKNIAYQQNPESLPIPIVVLDTFTTRIQELGPLVPDAVSLLDSDPGPGFYVVSSSS